MSDRTTVIPSDIARKFSTLASQFKIPRAGLNSITMYGSRNAVVSRFKVLSSRYAAVDLRPRTHTRSFCIVPTKRPAISSPSRRASLRGSHGLLNTKRNTRSFLIYPSSPYSYRSHFFPFFFFFESFFVRG